MYIQIMNLDNLKEEILSLSTLDRDNLLKDITDSLEHNQLVERVPSPYFR